MLKAFKYKHLFYLAAYISVLFPIIWGNFSSAQEISTTQDETSLQQPSSSVEEPQISTSGSEIAFPQPPVRVYSDQTQQIPVLYVRGRYFDPSGLISLGPLSKESNQSLKNQMSKCAGMGYRCFILRVDWRGIQPNRNRSEVGRVRELLNFAETLGIKVIISLELNRAPSWCLEEKGEIKYAMVSSLIDPEKEKGTGKVGDLIWGEKEGGVPILYHPEIRKAIQKLLYDVGNSLKDAKSLLGWYISGPVTLAYPGGGRDGVLGMCDYSPYTVNLFAQETGMFLMTTPYPRYSQTSWDERKEFRNFIRFRLDQKREVFNEVIQTLKGIDKNHPIFIGMEPLLNYRNDNGYLSLIQASDSTWQLLHPGIDGAIVSFQLSSNSFASMPDHTESSATHLLLTLNQILRNGKLALVIVEPELKKPPSTADIEQLAWMLKAAGAYPIWGSGFAQTPHYRLWSTLQENAIEKVQSLSILPPPQRLRRGQVAIFDLPRFYSAFYAEQNQSLVLSLLQLAMHQKTGVVLEVVGEDELLTNAPVLEQYKSLVYLTPELTVNQEAKSWIKPLAQIKLADFKNKGGMLEAVDPMLLEQYIQENYQSRQLEDQLRTRYIYRGATADDPMGAEVLIVANEPYIFTRVNFPRGSREIKVKLAGWPQSDLERVNLVEVRSGEPERFEIISGSVSFRLKPTQNTSNLYLLKDYYLPVAQQFEDRCTSIAIAQQTRHMRRNVPAVLLLAVLLGAGWGWMSFQTHQKSLLQAAELLERRRRLEPVSILDDAEAMAFYKSYVDSIGTETDETNPALPKSEEK